MNIPFPFELPGPTAFYISLLVLTFALHQAFMHYVLAGSLYVAWATLFPGTSNATPEANKKPRNEQLLAWLLRDWMPFLLSAAITAGVAPLLFIQIVYQKHFYTANLLLFWRWMAVVPVLIIAFYLLYLIKSQIMSRWPRPLAAAVAILTAGCFVFVGFCWSSNHLLGMTESKWPDIYITGRLPIDVTSMLSRMLLWISGSFASMTAMTAWQLRYHQQRHHELHGMQSPSGLAVLALSGLALLILAGSFSIAQSTAETQRLLFRSGATPYLFLSLIGILIQTVGWLTQYRVPQFRTSLLAVNSGGAVVTLLGISFIREAIRAHANDVSSQFAKHAAAAKVDGFSVFVVFTVMISAVIVWCFQIVRQGLQHSPEGTDAEGSHPRKSGH